MRTLLFTTLAAAALAPAAHAYNFSANKIAGNSHTVYLDPDVETTMPDHYERLQTAATKLDANASAMRFVLANDNDQSQSLNNNESEVGFTSDSVKLCGSLGCTTRWSSGGTIVETDTFFDIDYDWTLTSNTADSLAYHPGKKRPLLNTALHEFSHTLGMMHEADVFQVLGQAWTTTNANGALTQSVISEDTTSGLIADYGLRAASIEDLSLYHWERIGFDGDYSVHGRTPIMSSTGGPLAKANEDEPRYLVVPGLTIQLRATAENRGKTDHTVKLRWYVSTDNLITSGDTEIGSQDIGVNRNEPFTFTRTLTLPANLTPGATYWIGGILDADLAVTEQNESNNATYIAAVTML